MRLHPDRGGNAQKMAEFNECWDIIKERHFKLGKKIEYEKV
jgi:hypothetical protein